ncbi:MAG: hypothetical protein MUF04_12670 [Akkermansiaceae bacterium]|jgi:hypothetical protein|nr:hypothetical protein [Akkermansiaceae bacterium]
MDDSDRLLQRLATAARREAPPAPDEVPPGLATRVLARLREQPARSIWETSALAALPVAALITLACVLLGSPAAEAPDEAEWLSGMILESEIPNLPTP